MMALRTWSGAHSQWDLWPFLGPLLLTPDPRLTFDSPRFSLIGPTHHGTFSMPCTGWTADAMASVAGAELRNHLAVSRHVI
jgi:hypothetical protein